MLTAKATEHPHAITISHVTKFEFDNVRFQQIQKSTNVLSALLSIGMDG